MQNQIRGISTKTKKKKSSKGEKYETKVGTFPRTIFGLSADAAYLFLQEDSLSAKNLQFFFAD